jgi:holliday junction DNA helicase RuvB
MTNASAMNAAPQTIEHFVGAQEIKDRVKVALEATWNVGNGCVFPHTLALGAGGLGKTEISRIIAREMGVELVEVLGQSIRSNAELNAVLLQAEGGVCLIDEAHSLNDDVQVSLLKVLQEGMLFIGSRGGRIQTIQLKPFALIAATTDEWALTRPLVDRFRLILRFHHYSVEDMTLLVSRRARSAGVSLEEGVAEMIAQRSKGTPRLGIRLLDSCIRTMQAEASGTVSRSTFERTCRLEQIDGLGLDAVEQKYLHLLAQAKGTLRLNVLASSLGLPRATVERSIEPFLIRAQLIHKDDAGRSLTGRGWEHVAETRGQQSPQVTNDAGDDDASSA